MNREATFVDAALVTLTLLLPRVSLEGAECSLETPAVVTTHVFPGLGFTGGPHQLYKFVPLEGTARHIDKTLRLNAVNPKIER